MNGQERLIWAPERCDHDSRQSGMLIPILQRAQDLYGYLPTDVLKHISDKTGVPEPDLRSRDLLCPVLPHPSGKCIVKQCDGTACHVREREGSSMSSKSSWVSRQGKPHLIINSRSSRLLPRSCGLSPVATINDKVVGRLVPEKMAQLLRETK